MKKRVGSLLAAVLLLLTAGGGLTACGDSQGIDETKTQLYIGNFDGGFGDEWLSVLGDRFEELHANDSYEDGKLGVEIIVDPGTDNYTGTTIVSTMPSNRQDIYFTQNVTYSYAVQQGVLADITDIVTEKFDTVDLGEGEKAYSIEDKMREDVRNHFLTDDEKYYAIPFAAPLYGMMYDVDLFCEKNLYFLADGTINGSIDRETDQLAPGPDGEPDTYDDGLPATWEEFKRLMQTMITRNVTPFTWAGAVQYQRNAFITSVWASYEGYNDYTVNRTLNGTLSDGTVITEDKAYQLVNGYGRLAAATVAYDIVSSQDNFSSDAFLRTQTHTGAQEEFLASNPIDKAPIGILLEGGFWENEASGIFDDIVLETNNEAYSKENRRFSYMPVPRFVGTAGVPDQTNTEQVLVSTLDSICFINAATPHLELAKEFLQFMNSNTSLSTFNSVTGVTPGLRFTMSEDDYNAMTYYQKSVYDIVEASDFAVVRAGYGQSTIFQEYTNYMQYWQTGQTRINGTQYTEPMQSFHNYDTLTPEAWFNSYKNNYTAESWAAKRLP